MVTRIYMAALIAVFSLGFMIVPNETFGRSGGVGTRSSSVFHPSTMRAPIHRPSRNASSLQHRRQLGFGFPLLGSAAIYSYGTYSEPSNAPYSEPSNATNEYPSVYVDQSNPPSVYINQFSPPPNAEPTSSISDRYVYVYHPGCSSETVTVPWDDGKVHSVNIVRC
jgi:hypothetical protein